MDLRFRKGKQEKAKAHRQECRWHAAGIGEISLFRGVVMVGDNDIARGSIRSCLIGKGCPVDRIKNILVGIDFSACSATALRQAVRIGAGSGAKVSAVCVVPVPVYMVPDSPGVPFEMPPFEQLLVSARERWAAWGPAKEYGAGVEFRVVMGSPRQELINRSNPDSADLLVLGAHCDDDAKKVLGSVAAACVQRAHTLVLVVGEGATGPCTSVAACIDFYEISQLVLWQGICVAERDKAQLHFVHVYEDPWAGLGPPGGIRINMPNFAERYQQSIEQRLENFCKPFVPDALVARAHYHAIQSRSHGRGVVDFVTQQKCDLVVVGTKAKWNVHDFVWGTTAERVAREAPCSVLAVKPIRDEGG